MLKLLINMVISFAFCAANNTIMTESECDGPPPPLILDHSLEAQEVCEKS